MMNKPILILTAYAAFLTGYLVKDTAVKLMSRPVQFENSFLDDLRSE